MASLQKTCGKNSLATEWHTSHNHVDRKEGLLRKYKLAVYVRNSLNLFLSMHFPIFTLLHAVTEYQI